MVFFTGHLIQAKQKLRFIVFLFIFMYVFNYSVCIIM